MANKPTVPSFAANATFSASKADELADDLATAIQGCLGRGGTGESPNSMTGNLDMDTNRIQNLGDPTTGTDAANQRWVEQNYGAASTAEAEHWANYPEDSLVPEGDLVDDYSAKHFAAKAAADATATAADAVATAADAASTAADVATIDAAIPLGAARFFSVSINLLDRASYSAGPVWPVGRVAFKVNNGLRRLYLRHATWHFNTGVVTINAGPETITSGASGELSVDQGTAPTSPIDQTAGTGIENIIISLTCTSTYTPTAAETVVLTFEIVGS